MTDDKAQGSQQPEESRPTAQPAESRPAPQPEESRPTAEPAESRPAPQPEESRPAPQPAESGPAVQPEESRPAPQPAESGPTAQPERHVLMLMEDDSSMRSLLQMMLGEWHFEVMTFIDGFRAAAWLDQVEAGKFEGRLPSVALLDIRVPGPQGTEIAQRMRAIPATAHIPIVIMTAYYLGPVEKKLIFDNVRPDDLLQKGDLDFDVLQEKLVSLIKSPAPPESQLTPGQSDGASPR